MEAAARMFLTALAMISSLQTPVSAQTTRTCAFGDVTPLMGLLDSGCMSWILPIAMGTGELPAEDVICGCLVQIPMDQLPDCNVGDLSIRNYALNSCGNGDSHAPTTSPTLPPTPHLLECGVELNAEVQPGAAVSARFVVDEASGGRGVYRVSDCNTIQDTVMSFGGATIDSDSCGANFEGGNPRNEAWQGVITEGNFSVEVSFHRSVSCATTSNAALCRIRLLLECPAQLLLPTCPPSCDMYCEHGNQVDEAGCDICACNEPPSTTAPASNACTMTALIPLVTQMSQSCMAVLGVALQPPFVLPDIETLCGCLLTVNPVTLPEGVGCQFGDWTLDRNLYAACNVAATTEAAVDTTVPVGFCTEHSNCDGPTYCNVLQRCFPCTLCAMLNDGMFAGCAEACPADPTTTEAAATTEAAETTAAGCPRNCGTPERGGGTCRANGRCTSCNDNRLRVSGRCVQSVGCRARRIQSGSMAGEGCRCLNEHCHYCNRVVTGDTCRVCRDGWFLLDGDCVEACPDTMTSLGIGNFKRRCLGAFTCQNGRIIGADVNYGCKCATDENTPASCQFCEFRAGEHGQHCTRCLGGQFLQADNRCHDGCDGTGLIEYAPGNYGRECRAPFTCTDRIDNNGAACKCARAVGRNNCASCDYTADGPVCSRCANSKLLENGACVDECSSGSPVGSGTDGLECQ